METLSVVHAAPELGIGGTQKALQLLVTHFDDERFDVSVIGIERGGERADILRADGYDIFVADGDADRLVTYLEDRNVDILHLHGAGAGPTAAPAAQRASVPIVVKTDNFGWTDDRPVARHVDRYYFVSRTILLRYLLLNRIPLTSDWWDDYEVLYNPVVEPSSDEDDGVAFREEHGIPADAPLLGKIGRPTPAKWGRITVTAFERVVEQRPDALLALVTPPNEISRELRERGLADHVVTLDRIPPERLDAFYRAIDVLTHSSAMGETFGYVIAEAFTNETPVVVNANPLRDNAQIEIVDHGETGYVANSTGAYADATLELLENDQRRRAFGRRARERVLMQYGAPSITAELEREYRALAHESGIGGQPVDRSVTDIAAFRQEYRRRLDSYYGDSGLSYQTERRLWDLTTRVLPTKREPVYKACRLLLTKLVEDYTFS